MAGKLDSYQLNNGMMILAEQMEVGSVAFGLMLPCGTARIDKGCGGAGNVISDWVMRGAGDKSNRELTDELEGLGLHRGSGIGTYCLTFSASMEASNLIKALRLYSDIVQRPKLDSDQFELAKKLAMHEIAGLEENPKQKVMIRLKEHFFADPLGRSSVGTEEELQNLKQEKAKAIIDHNFNLSQTILTVAGKYNFDELCDEVSKLFDNEQKPFESEIKKGERDLGYTHIHHDGAQVHIGIMVEVPSARSKDYYNILTAVSILSGGISSRLFTEVREKRGLCYAIGANYMSLRDRAGIACYAGTTPDKAQETLEVAVAEIRKLSKGITAEELHRAKIGLKSNLIMKSESSMSRASGIGGDYNMLGRVRDLDEIKKSIDNVSIESIMDCLEINKFKEYCTVSIGSKKLETAGIFD